MFFSACEIGDAAKIGRGGGLRKAGFVAEGNGR